MRIAHPDTSNAKVQIREEVVTLFELHRDSLLRYVCSLGLPVQDGEEITQEVFLALFRHLRDGKPRENLRGWIFRVGHNLAIKQRVRESAKNYSGNQDLIELQTDPDPNPEEQAMTGESHIRLAAVMRALPERDRICLALKAEGFRYREISAMLNLSLGSVAQSIARSLTKMKNVNRVRQGVYQDAG